jgi:hypothetical protein
VGVVPTEKASDKHALFWRLPPETSVRLEGRARTTDMEPQHLFRTSRRRWRPAALLAVAESLCPDPEEAIDLAAAPGAAGRGHRLLQDDGELCNSQHHVESNSLKSDESAGTPIVPPETLESA